MAHLRVSRRKIDGWWGDGGNAVTIRVTMPSLLRGSGSPARAIFRPMASPPGNLPRGSTDRVASRWRIWNPTRCACRSTDPARWISRAMPARFRLSSSVLAMSRPRPSRRGPRDVAATGSGEVRAQRVPERQGCGSAVQVTLRSMEPTVARFKNGIWRRRVHQLKYCAPLVLLVGALPLCLRAGACGDPHLHRDGLRHGARGGADRRRRCPVAARRNGARRGRCRSARAH